MMTGGSGMPADAGTHSARTEKTVLNTQRCGEHGKDAPPDVPLRCDILLLSSIFDFMILVLSLCCVPTFECVFLREVESRLQNLPQPLLGKEGSGLATLPLDKGELEGVSSCGNGSHHRSNILLRRLSFLV